MYYFKLALCIVVNFSKATNKKNAIGKTLGVGFFIQLCTINIFIITLIFKVNLHQQSHGLEGNYGLIS